jgi:hypothetical protein
VIPAGALLCALAAAGDPCLVTDEAGRSFRACFDPGNRIEVAVGARTASGGGAEGGALDLSAAWRWRSDLVGEGGRSDPVGGGGKVEWLRDQAVADVGAALRHGAFQEARAVAWRGVFVRRLAEPFILLPGSRPMRLPFPFDVGVSVEAGGVRWARARQREADLTVIRAALLLDLARYLGPVRRAAFGPELSYDLWLSRDATPVQVVVPFTAGALEVAAESDDGRWLGALSARGGVAFRAPRGSGGSAGFAAATLRGERVVVAVNDLPVALGLEVRAGQGASGSGPARLEAALVLRVAAPR